MRVRSRSHYATGASTTHFVAFITSEVSIFEFRLKEVSEECLRLGAVDVLCIPADVGIERECRDAIKKTVDHFGRKVV